MTEAGPGCGEKSDQREVTRRVTFREAELLGVREGFKELQE